MVQNLNLQANDVVFCGRIIMFLAHFFPLSERSGPYGHFFMMFAQVWFSFFFLSLGYHVNFELMSGCSCQYKGCFQHIK